MRLIGHPLFKLLTTILLFVLISLKVDVAEAGKRLLTLPPLFAAAVTATAFSLYWCRPTRPRYFFLKEASARSCA